MSNLQMVFSQQQEDEIVRIRDEIQKLRTKFVKIPEQHLLFNYALLSVLYDHSALMAGAEMKEL